MTEPPAIHPAGHGAGGHEPPDPILDLLGGKTRAQAVSTAAALGVPDALLDGPLSIDDLARRLACQRDTLESLMRLLAGLGLFHCPEPGAFALTSVGRRLCQDDLGPLATYLGAPEQWDPWARLRDALTQPADPPNPPPARNAFEHTFDTSLYGYLADHPPAAARYDAAIDSFTRHEVDHLCDAYDFADAQHVVDVGGGQGALLAHVLDRWPHLQGTLFDLPHVVERARSPLEQRHPGRTQATGGNLFAEGKGGIPAGADHYLVKHVLHNWGDDDAAAILRRCAQAGGPDTRILAIDAILAPDTRPDMAALLDLEMRVLTDGKGRRKPEMRRLFQRAGLRLERVVPLAEAGWLMVAAPTT